MLKSEPPVVVSCTYNTDAAKIWSALTDPEEMRQWYFELMEDFEARPGFETRFVIANEGRTFTHDWRVSDLKSGEWISVEWRFKEYPGLGLVTFKIEEQESGTTLTVINEVLEDFPADIPEFKWESCQGGWKYFIQERLFNYLS